MDVDTSYYPVLPAWIVVNSRVAEMDLATPEAHRRLT
jgi:hypothetical protein